MSKAYCNWGVEALESVQLVINNGSAFDMKNISNQLESKEVGNQFDFHEINDSEKRFKRFCDKKGVVAVFLHQSPNSFSSIIKENRGKRPDFKIISIFGDFYVDVKTSKLSSYTKYTIDIIDLEKLKKSQNLLRKSIYLAYPTDPWYKGEDWGFISINRVCRLKKEQEDLIQNGYKFVGIEYDFLKKFNELI